MFKLKQRFITIREEAIKKADKNNNEFSAFTLAEMMIVMLIISIVLAAMAPVMTTRNKVDNSSPWHWVTSNPSDAYFGPGQAMRAFIGQSEATQTAAGADIDFAKLIINTAGSSLSHILFKSNANILGELYMSKDGTHGSSIVLGNRRSPAAAIGNENINIGWNNWPNGDLTGASNITIGDESMQSLTSGGHNIGLGTTLSAVTTGEHNIGIGDDSMVAITGSGNIGIGGSANAAATSVSKTIAIGSNAVANGNGAIAIGGALTNAENHGETANAAQARVFKSIAIGSGATSGSESGAGNDSIAIGSNANANTTDGSGTRGLAIGVSSTANADNAVSIGSSANSSASNTVSIGKGTTSSANNAIAIGVSSSASAGSGIAIGNTSQASGTSGIAIGENATASGSADVVIGKGAKTAGDDTHGENVAIGYLTMGNNSDTAVDNVAIGTEALRNVTTGSTNLAIGYRAAINTTNGIGNISLGTTSMYNTTTGSYNVAIGVGALHSNTTGSTNTAIGYGACYDVKGSNKTCIGSYSGPTSSSDWASESDNTEHVFIGSQSKFNGGSAVLEVMNSRNQLKFDGTKKRFTQTGVIINGNLIVKGVIITRGADNGGPSGDYFTGYTDRVSALGITGEKNFRKAMLYNTDELYRTLNADGAFSNGDSTHYSDRRLKYVGKENTSGLEKIRQLKVFNYTFKKDTTKEPHVGVIAQDLQKVFPDAVKKGTDGFLSIRMEDMFYAVINAIKELDAKYQAQEKRINDTEKRIKESEQRINDLEKRIKLLETKVK